MTFNNLIARILSAAGFTTKGSGLLNTDFDANNQELDRRTRSAMYVDELASANFATRQSAIDALTASSSATSGDVMTRDANGHAAWATPAAAGTWSSAQTIYVATTGSDTTGTGTSGAPFASVQKALNVLNAKALGGFAHTISVANGTYSAGFVAGSQTGGGSITITGNVSTPSSCVFSWASGQYANFSGSYSFYNIQGFKFTGATTIAIMVSGIGTTLNHAYLDFGITGVGGVHFYLSGVSCSVGCTGGYNISASAYAHVYSTLGVGNSFVVWNKTISLVNSPAWSVGFVYAANLNFVHFFANTVFSGASTGPRYYVTSNAVLSTDGAGPSFLPGSTAGSTATGGQYV